METINFKASELIIKEVNGVEYLNIRNANDNALIKMAKTIGVSEYIPTDEYGENGGQTVDNSEESEEVQDRDN